MRPRKAAYQRPALQQSCGCLALGRHNQRASACSQTCTRLHMLSRLGINSHAMACDEPSNSSPTFDVHASCFTLWQHLPTCTLLHAQLGILRPPHSWPSSGRSACAVHTVHVRLRHYRSEQCILTACFPRLITTDTGTVIIPAHAPQLQVEGSCL